MAGWSGADTALWVRGAVQELQLELIQRVPGAALRRDGRYGEQTHRALVMALSQVRSEYGFVEDVLPGLVSGQGGPGATAVALGLTEEQARAVEAAWAWWAVKRLRPIPRGAYQALGDYNQYLGSSGDEILTPTVAEEFIEPRIDVSGSNALILLGSFLVTGLVIGGGYVWGRRECGVGRR